VISLLLLTPVVGQAGTTVENIRVWAENGKTRVVLDLSKPAEHNIFTLRGPDRLVVDLKNGRLSDSLARLPAGTGVIKAFRTGVRANGPTASFGSCWTSPKGSDQGVLPRGRTSSMAIGS
jgi:N-acetylmuramoyl-L-alanine amidase